MDIIAELDQCRAHLASNQDDGADDEEERSDGDGKESNVGDEEGSNDGAEEGISDGDEEDEDEHLNSDANAHHCPYWSCKRPRPFTRRKDLRRHFQQRMFPVATSLAVN